MMSNTASGQSSFVTTHPIRTLDAALRYDLYAFIAKAFSTISPGVEFALNWHIESIAHHLSEVYRGQIKRLIITMPPRSLKSICASVAFPAWVLGKDPTKRIICASYAQDLSAKLANDGRALMHEPWYRRVFPQTAIDPSKNTESEIMTTKRGFRLATSVGGPLTGRGGNIIIVDDPFKPSEGMSQTKRDGVKQWFDNTLYSRLDDKVDDAIIVVMQRVHLGDLAGYLLDKGGWVHLNLPAVAEEPQTIQLACNRWHQRQTGEVLHPEREPLHVLESTKRIIGSYDFSAQYQQAPIPPGGGMIKWNWFGRYRELPAPADNHRVIQSWDTACKVSELADYSVGTTWLKTKHNGHYLIDVFRDKLEYPALKRKILQDFRENHIHTIILEDKSSGTSLIQDLESEGVPVIGFQPKDDKIMRMHSQTAIIEAGLVHLPKRASWLDAFKAEMCVFPHGSNDDQVDSVSQYLQWAERENESFVSIIRF